MKTSMQNYQKEHMAVAFLVNDAISKKHSVEIANAIRHLTTKDAKALLEEVILKKSAIPFRRYKRDLAHRTKIGPGRYPINAAKQFLMLIKSAEANAEQKALAGELEIVHCSASVGVRSWHYGRQRRRKTKSTNIDIVVQEIKDNTKKDTAKKGSKKSTENKIEENGEKK